MKIRRPICKVAIGLLLGIIGGLYWGNQAVLFSLLLMALGLCTIVFPIHKNWKIQKLFFSKENSISLIFILMISILANGYMQYTENQYNTMNEQQKQEASWKGVVSSEKVEKTYKDQYIVKLENGMRCYVYTKKGKEAIGYGDEVRIYGEYKEQEGQKNPHGYDARLYARTKKILGSIQAEKIECIAHKKENGLQYAIFQVRKYGLERIEKAFPTKAGFMVQALILGDKTNIPEEVLKEFREGNVAHMLAISGAHISYILIAILSLERFCGKRSVQIFLLVFLSFFAVLVGATPSVMRACMMSGFFILGNLLYRRSCVYTNMAMSLIFLCIHNPYCLWDLGLQLSYIGTLGILIGMPIWKSYPQMWIKCGRQT